jgi:hypothetical protein
MNNLPEQKFNVIENTSKKNSRFFLTILTNLIYEDWFQVWKVRNDKVINWENENNINNKIKRRPNKNKNINKKPQKQNINNKLNRNTNINNSIERWINLGWKFNKAVAQYNGSMFTD